MYKERIRPNDGRMLKKRLLQNKLDFHIYWNSLAWEEKLFSEFRNMSE